MRNERILESLDATFLLAKDAPAFMGQYPTEIEAALAAAIAVADVVLNNRPMEDWSVRWKQSRATRLCENGRYWFGDSPTLPTPVVTDSRQICEILCELERRERAAIIRRTSELELSPTPEFELFCELADGALLSGEFRFNFEREAFLSALGDWRRTFGVPVEAGRLMSRVPELRLEICGRNDCRFSADGLPTGEAELGDLVERVVVEMGAVYAEARAEYVSRGLDPSGKGL